MVNNGQEMLHEYFKVKTYCSGFSVHNRNLTAALFESDCNRSPGGEIPRTFKVP